MKKIILCMALAMGTYAMAQEKPTSATVDQRKEEIMKKNNEIRKKSQLERMKKELNLTDDQVTKIKALQDKRSQEVNAQKTKMQEVKKENMQNRKSAQNDMDSEMQKILTPEQYTKWNTQRKERAEKLKERSSKMSIEAVKDK